jgi:glutaredoxin 3
MSVTMYTTGVCPFCIRAKSLLTHLGVSEVNEIRVDKDPDARRVMEEKTGRRTVPQIYIGDTHVGGAEDLQRLHSQGMLMEMLGTPRSSTNVTE